MKNKNKKSKIAPSSAGVVDALADSFVCGPHGQLPPDGSGTGSVGSVSSEACGSPGAFSVRFQEVIELGKHCLLASVKFGESWRAFTIVLRDFLPKEQTAIAIAAGFSPSQASRFKQIVSLPSDDFKQYASGALSWRPALEKAREANRKRTGTVRKVDHFLNVAKVAVRNKKYLAANKSVKYIGAGSHTDGFSLVCLSDKAGSFRIQPDIASVGDSKLGLFLFSQVRSLESGIIEFDNVILRYAVEPKVK